MAEECDLVYHNHMHSVNTLISLNACVLYVVVAICALLIFDYICSWQRTMGFVEDFEMQINCPFIR